VSSGWLVKRPPSSERRRSFLAIEAILATFDGFQEVIEERPGVMRAGCRLGMVLYCEDWQAFMTQPLERAVIQIQVRDLEIRGAGDPRLAPLDGKAVILRRDEHLARGELFDGMISAAVPIWELERSAAKGERE
jgi:hypothetical protein